MVPRYGSKSVFQLLNCYYTIFFNVAGKEICSFGIGKTQRNPRDLLQTQASTNRTCKLTKIKISKIMFAF
jgi:hypothetical protein